MKMEMFWFYIGSVLFFAAGLVVYGLKEKTAYDEVLKETRAIKNELNATKNLLAANIETVGKSNLKIGELQKQIKDIELELDSVQVHFANLRKNQISMNEKISSKPKTLVIQGAIPIEVQSTPKVKSYNRKGAAVPQ